MHILAISLWLVAPADAPLRLYPTAPPPPAVAAAPYKSRRAKTPSPTPTPLHSHAALRKPTAKSNPNPEPVGSGRRSRERAPRGSRESRGGRDHGAGDLAATPSSRRRFPRRNRRRSFAAAGAAPCRWPMQVETAAVRLPFSVGAGFRLPVAVSGGTVFAVWYYDTADTVSNNRCTRFSRSSSSIPVAKKKTFLRNNATPPLLSKKRHMLWIRLDAT